MATLAQLRACADRIGALREELDSELERRNELIVALVDQGESRRAIYAEGRVSPTSVCKFLALAG